MKMKLTLYATAAAVLVAAAGCNRGERHTADARITITTSIEPLTRAPQLDEQGRGTFSAGDLVSVLVYDATQRAAFDYAVGTAGFYWKDTPFGTQSGKVSFSACYPKQELGDGAFRFDLEESPDKDLLLARTTGVDAGSEQPVVLKFRHAMHRLTISYATEDPEIVPDDIETRCTAKSACTVHLAENRLETDETSRATFSEPGGRAVFLLVPQKSNGVLLEIDLGAEVKRLALDTLAGIGEELEGGKQLHITLTVKNGRIEIGDTAIEGWEDQGSIEDDIVL